MNRQPLGTAVPAELSRNCLICNRYQACRDPAKNYRYACTKFVENAELSLDDMMETSMSSAQRIERDIANARDESSLEAVIEKVLNSGIPVPPDLKIDDRDIPRPKNYVEWTMNPLFIGSELQPFGKQIQVGAHVMAEWCPRCSDEEYFENVPVDDRYDDIAQYVEFLEFGRCPRCKANKFEMVHAGELDDPDEMVGIAGQRSSKSITATQIDSYNHARWLLTPNIPATYNLLPSTVLTSTYTATTFGQARENYWEPLNNIFTTSAWFVQYHAFLRDQGNRFGEELINHTDTVLRYRHKNIMCAPASPSKRTMRGRTRIGAAIDELGWFPVGQKQAGGDFERLDAKEVHKALKNSLRTMTEAYRKRFRQGYVNIPKPIMLNISSPSAQNDMIMTLYRSYINSRSVYVFKYPTWEFNPDLPRSAFDEDFRIAPIESARDFGCEPPLANNPWMRDQAAVESVFDGPMNGVKLTRVRTRSKSDKILTSAMYRTGRAPTSEYGGILSLDVGWNNNSYAFSIAYPNSIPDEEDEDNEDLHVGVEFFAFGEIMPKTDAPMSYVHLYNNVILPLCNEFNIAVMVSDRWQNKHTAQNLEEFAGLTAFEYQCKMQDFDDFREAIFNKMVQMPRLEKPTEEIVGITLEEYPDCFLTSPVSHLFYQMLTVQNTGRTVIKGDATDDLFRTAVLGYTMMQDPEVLDICLEYNASGPVRRAALGANPTGASSIAPRIGVQLMAGAAPATAMGGSSRGGRRGAVGVNAARMG